MERLSERDSLIVKECLRATVEGPFFPGWEFHTLFGLTRDEVRSVLESWPETESPDNQDLAVGNALNNLLGYPHDKGDAWAQYISAGPDEVAAILSRWRGDDGFDESPKGYFDRLK